MVLTTRADRPDRNALAIRFQEALGNVTFLERPFHPTTLANVVRAALRSRRRQYGAREVLERRDLLARELQHRTKNLIAVIQAIASASLQESHGKEAFFDRLHALAKAQDLIIEGAGRGALMRQVVEVVLQSFGTASFGRRTGGLPQFGSCAKLCTRIARIGDQCCKTRVAEHRRWDGISSVGHRCHDGRNHRPLSLARKRRPSSHCSQPKGIWHGLARTCCCYSFLSPAALRLFAGRIFL